MYARDTPTQQDVQTSDTHMYGQLDNTSHAACHLVRTTEGHAPMAELRPRRIGPCLLKILHFPTLFAPCFSGLSLGVSVRFLALLTLF